MNPVRTSCALVVLVSSLVACRSSSSGSPDSSGSVATSMAAVSSSEAWPDAALGVRDPKLAQLCARAWRWRLAADRIEAGRLGDVESWGQLTDNSPAARRARVAELRTLAGELREISPDGLDVQDRITRAELLESCELPLALDDRGLELASWNLDARTGPQVEFAAIAAEQPAGTPDERERLVARWHAMARYVDQAAANLSEALARNRVCSRKAAIDVFKQLDTLLSTPLERDPLLQPALGGGSFVTRVPGRTLESLASEHGWSWRELQRANRFLLENAAGHTLTLYVPSKDDALSLTERAKFVEAVYRAVRDEIRPAFDRYRGVIAREVLPRVRSDEKPGLCGLEGGLELYRLLARAETSLDLAPEAIHEIGTGEIARIRAETEALGQKVLGLSSFAEIQKKLRNDAALHFTTAEEIRETARRSLARAEAALPGNFGLLPRARCHVVDIPPLEAPFTTIAYYRQPAAPGSVPDDARFGRYFVNTYAATTRPRYEAQALAFHESVPGHHLQIAIAQELSELPLVRRNFGCTAYVEGWALYTERLADELGLYESESDRFGMLSYDAWRASRLVVDTGLHALGWSRERAIEYMEANTLLARNNIENEVDRYIATPGQALAYKLGQREILSLRAEARERLGERFKLADFHDRVLENGAVTLAVLRAQVEAWIERESVARKP